MIIVVVETAVDVETTVLVLIAGDALTVVVAVRVVVCVVVPVAVLVRISVRVVCPSPPLSFPEFNLCCAPAKRPMNTELNNKSRRTRTSRILVSVVSGSCTMDDIRCANVCFGGGA